MTTENRILILVGQIVRSAEVTQELTMLTEGPKDKIELLKRHRAYVKERLEELDSVDTEDIPLSSSSLAQVIIKLKEYMDEVEVTMNLLDLELEFGGCL